MRNKAGIWLLSFIASILLLASGCGGGGRPLLGEEDPNQTEEVTTDDEPQTDPENFPPPLEEGFGSFQRQTMELKNTNKTDKEGNAIGGFASGPGISIEWEGTYKPNAATPLHVLKLAAERMSHLQKTPQSSDVNARALFEVLEAIDALEGTNEVSSSVGPGFISPDGE